MRHHLIAGASLCALVSGAGAALAQDLPVETGALVVYGQGQARQVQTVTAAELAVAAPGTSPVKIVEKLPGVNFQSADAFGAYEWSTRISIRGFNQNQLGFTLDGVPLGDMSYGNFNGLHISRAITSENLGGVELAQGAGALATASTSNLGGALMFTSRTPSEKMGVLGAATLGSNNMRRFFGRIDMGEIPAGTRAYVSYVNQYTDKWKGDGAQKQQQFDIKLVQPIGQARLTGFLDWSRRRENDYQDLSLDMIKRLGYDWDNISGDYALAVRLADIGNNRGDSGVPPTNAAAGSTYPAPIKTLDDAYFNASGLRNDTLWSVNLDTPLFTDAVKLNLTAYGHDNAGQGTWYSPYVPSPNAFTPGANTDNSPISVRTTEYDIKRRGAILGLSYAIGPHLFSAGGWYEDNDFNQARRFYGLNRGAANRDSLKFMTDPFATQWQYAFNTETLQGYVQDVWTVTPGVKLNFGFKALRVKSDSVTVVGSPVINGSITSEDGFLPQAGATWRVNGNHEVFAGYTRNMRAFGAAHTGLSPFATTQAGFDGTKDKLKPETSDTIEAGWRFRADGLQGVLAVYYVKFDNRLIGTSAGAGIVGNPTILANAGSVTSKGFEALATWRITPWLSLFGTYAYNDSKYDDDVLGPNGAVAQKISGKTTTDTPKHLLKGELSVDYQGWFAKAAANYTSRRYFTYTNDQSVPGYVMAELSAGYRFDGEGWAKGLEIQGNVTNLFDHKYVATIGSNGFGYSGDNQTLLAGAPRQFFVTVRKQF